MASLSRIAATPDLTEQVYQRLLYAICDGELVERFVNTLQVISASAPLRWLQLGELASTAWQN